MLQITHRAVVFFLIFHHMSLFYITDFPLEHVCHTLLKTTFRLDNNTKKKADILFEGFIDRKTFYKQFIVKYL